MAVLSRRLVVLLLCLAVSFPAAAQQVQLAEQKIKAGMVYNFLKYTNWPNADAAAPMQLCIFGADPFGGSLQPLVGRSVNQRSIVLRHIKSEEAASCDLLIIAAAEKKRWPEISRLLTGKPVLTVSEIKGFTDSGGMIAFGHRQSRIQALLHTGAITAAGLTVEDRLLGLVTVVGDKGVAP